MRPLAIALLFAGLAFSKDPKSKVKQSPGDGHEDAFLTGPESESYVVREVRHRLVMLPWYGVFDDLGFTVNAAGDTVTLVGEVTQPVLKEDAERAVKQVEGVRTVVNNIEVLPLSPFDDNIRRRVYRAVFGDPAIGPRYGFSAIPSIHIIVKNGHVRLEGVVSSEFDRTIVGMRAAGVPGTFEVINSLKIEKR